MLNSPETLQKKRERRALLKQTIDPSSFPKYIERVCIGCLVTKPCRWLSSFTVKGKPEYRTRCDECYNQYKLSNDKKYRLQRTETARKRIIERKKKFVELLGGKCIKCGYNKSLAALTFHHRNPKEKDFNIAGKYDHSLEKILNELKKCDLLCFNCHMEIHEKWGDNSCK